VSGVYFTGRLLSEMTRALLGHVTPLSEICNTFTYAYVYVYEFHGDKSAAVHAKDSRKKIYPVGVNR